MPHAAITDKELVAQVVRGRTDAFGQLVERHIHGAYAIAYARVGNVTDAEDAVQEAFLRALEKLRSLRDPAKFGSWLLSIARNEAARISTLRTRSVNDAPNADAVVMPEAGSQEMNALVRERVMRLPEQHREILLLHYFTGRSTNEIAELLALRRSAVRKRLQRAREQLAETMLRDLETTRPTADTFAPQVTRIMGLVGAAALANVSMGPAATAAGLSMGFMLYKPLLAVLIAGAGISIGYTALQFARSSLNPEGGAALAANISSDSADDSPREQEVNQADEPEPASPAPVPAATTDLDNAAIRAAAPESEPDNTDVNLTGTWRFWAFSDEDPSVEQGPGEYVELKQQGSVVTFRLMMKPSASGQSRVAATVDPASPPLGEGRVTGDRFVVTLKPSNGDNEVFKLEGPYEPSADEMILRGTVTKPGQQQFTETKPGTVRIDKSAAIEIATRWRRQTPEIHSRDEYIRARIKELQELSQALNRYTVNNSGRMPQHIEELVPLYLTSMQPYRPEAGVTLEYTPVVHEWARGVYPQYQDIVGPEASFGQDLNLQSRLIAVEEAWRKYWGDRFTQRRIVVRATYNQYDLVLAINDFGHVGTLDEMSCTRVSTGEVLSRPQQEMAVTECQNHLKQLGMSVKMFASEGPEKRFPGGWLTMHGEYLPNTCTVVCPGATAAEISYELLFPAVTAKELEATFDELVGDTVPADQVGNRGYKQAHIPIIIEINECSQSGGRNILFLDGHTEHRKGRLEDHADLAPFLNLR